MPVTRNRYATGMNSDCKAAQLAAKFGNMLSKLFMERPLGVARLWCVEIQHLVGLRGWRCRPPLGCLPRGVHGDHYRENHERGNGDDDQFLNHWSSPGTSPAPC